MPVKDQNIEVVGEDIHILRKKYNVLAFASNSNDLLEKLRGYTWTPTEGYMKSSNLSMSLHKYVMVEKYGEDVIVEAYANNFVIDHINNDGMDCRYSNLALIPGRLNVAKGQTYDIDRNENLHKFAINFSLDEESEEYQIGIAFNNHCNLIRDGKTIPIAGMYIKYGNDYKTTFLDAQIIINDLIEYGGIKITKLHTSKVIFKEAILVQLAEEEKGRAFIFRNGQLLVVQGSESLITTQPAHNKKLHRDNIND